MRKLSKNIVKSTVFPILRKRRFKKENPKDILLKNMNQVHCTQKLKSMILQKQKPEKQKRKRKHRKRKLKRLNPIYLISHLGSDEWDYIDKINLEKEVLGDL